jgi:hypothetical protein
MICSMVFFNSLGWVQYVDAPAEWGRRWWMR